MTLRGTFLRLLLVIMAAAMPGAPGEGLRDRDANPTVRKNTSNNSDWSQDTKAGKQHVRLTNSACRGFVELRHHGQWLPLCQESLDEITASVLCRMLDCGRAVSWMKAPDDGNGLATSSNATEIAIAASTALNRTAAYVLWLRCAHPESALENCTVTQDLCHSERPAELNCTGVRLVGGPSRCAGRVEVEDPARGSWGTVCDDSWDLSEGQVVCRQLECGSAVYTPGQAHFGKGDGLIHLDELNCLGSEASLWDCPADRTTDCGHKEDASVVCSVFLELMPTISVIEDSFSTIPSSSVKATEFLDPRNDEVTSRQSQSLLLLCIFLALILLGTLLGCGLIVFRMHRKQRITSEEPRMPSLMRQGAPVLLSHSYQAPSLPTAIAVADTNINQDSSLTLTPNPQVPAAGPSPAPGKDSDSDYEDYDFSSKPPKTLSSFYNSLRYRPIDERNPQNTAQMATLQEMTGTEAPAALTENLREAPDAAPRQVYRKQEDALSISSEEDYGISSSQMKNCSDTVPHQTNREAPPVPSKPSRAGTHLPASGHPGLHQPDSCFVELEKDPELERMNARKSVVSRPTGSPARLKHYPRATDDSSSTSSGEEDWYQNWKPPPHTPQSGNARPFPGDSGASSCSREASSHWL